MNKKDVKLTNWQVPKNPASAVFDQMKNAPPINYDNYKDVGKVEHHDSVESVASKMIAKQEAAIGIKIDQKETPKALNLNGIVDDRADRKFFRKP